MKSIIYLSKNRLKLKITYLRGFHKKFNKNEVKKKKTKLEINDLNFA